MIAGDKAGRGNEDEVVMMHFDFLLQTYDSSIYLLASVVNFT